MSKSPDPLSTMSDYEKTLATSRPYRNSFKPSAEEQLATDLEEFRREKEFVTPGEAGTFSGRDFRGAWKMGDIRDTPRDTMDDRARREELVKKDWKPGTAGTVNHETGVIPDEQPDRPGRLGDKRKKNNGMRLKARLRSSLRRLRPR